MKASNKTHTTNTISGALRMEFRSFSWPDADRKGEPGSLRCMEQTGRCQEQTGVKFARRAGGFPGFLSFRAITGTFSCSGFGRRPTLPFPVKMFAYWILTFGNIWGQLGKYLLGLRLIRSHSRANGLIRARGSRDVERISGIVSGIATSPETDRPSSLIHKSKQKAAIANS